MLTLYNFVNFDVISIYLIERSTNLGHWYSFSNIRVHTQLNRCDCWNDRVDYLRTVVSSNINDRGNFFYIINIYAYKWQ